jgi:hypothetical protein
MIIHDRRNKKQFFNFSIYQRRKRISVESGKSAPTTKKECERNEDKEKMT